MVAKRPQNALVITTRDQYQNELAILDQLTALVEASQDPEELKSFHDKVAALEEYAFRSSQGLAAQNHLGRKRLLIEWRAGGLLKDLALHGGNRDLSAESKTTLAQMNINKKQSSCWQKIALLTRAELEDFCDECDRELTEIFTKRAAQHAVKLKKKPKKNGQKNKKGGTSANGNTNGDGSRERTTRDNDTTGDGSCEDAAFRVSESLNHIRTIQSIIHPLIEHGTLGFVRKPVFPWNRNLCQTAESDV